ncbi:MAG: hypothetical protein D5S00_05955 [Tindallia sp. MSAO_Bac2]|nr:MAG: hypothetical protein D5S00_05955 [Tindallia sp. MSAO_Bac2]
MQIESILIFVVLIALTSLSNKRKQAQQQRKKQQKTARTQQQEPKNTTAQTMTKEPSRNKGKKSLQDIFREMQSELELEYGMDKAEQKKQDVENTEKSLKSTQPSDMKAHNKSVDRKKAGRRKEVREPTEETKQNSPIYTDEIKDEAKPRSLEINSKTVFNGVIFSEILGKPKGRH